MDTEKRRDEVRTESGIEVKPLYKPDDLQGFDYSERLGDPGEYPSPVAPTPPCTGAGPGPCASTPVSAPPERPMPASSTARRTARQGSRWRSTFPRRWAGTPTTGSPSGRSER